MIVNNPKNNRVGIRKTVFTVAISTIIPTTKRTALNGRICNFDFTNLLTYPKQVMEYERQELIHNCQVLRESVQNVADEVCVKELHCGVDDVVCHVFVQIYRGSFRRPKKSEGSAEVEDTSENDHDCVHEQNIVTSFCGFSTLVFRDVGIVVDGEIGDFLFQIYPKTKSNYFFSVVPKSTLPLTD
jgi:hypothetical protein